MKTEKSKLEISGAGGNWQIIDEMDDPMVIQQQDNVSCGPACAEMLLKAIGVNDIGQEHIASVSGTPVDVNTLAQALQELDYDTSRKWIGGSFEIPGANDKELLEALMSTGLWIAALRDPRERLAHLVVVDGYDTDGRLCIRDTWNKTRYKMDKYTFLQYWTLQGVYLKKL